MDDRSERVAKRFEIPILIAAALVIPALLLQASGLGPGWKTFAYGLDWLIWVAFVVEWVVMMWVVPRKGEWVRTHKLDTVIVFLTVPFLPGLFAALRLARLARLLRVLRLLMVVRSAQLARRIFSLEGLQWAAVLVLMTVLLGGLAFAHVESQDTWDGVWWAVVTATTVGYGDIPVTTDAGRVIAIVIMLASISFVALLTGAIVERFVAGPPSIDVGEGGTLESDALREIAEIRAQVRGLVAVEARLARLEEALRNGRLQS
jgi:voltage-gated potassium channel